MSGGLPVDPTSVETSATQATAATQTSAPASWLQHFAATTAQLFQGREGQTIKLEGPIAVEFGATLTFSNFGRGGAPGKPTFTIATAGGIPPSSQPARAMTKDEEKAVLAALDKQLGTQWTGQPDRAAVQAFRDRLSEAVGASGGVKPSTKFDGVRWGDAKADGKGGYLAEGGVGVDQVMDVHLDKHGKLTSSMRLAMGHLPSVATPLSAADRADLAKSIEAFLANKKIPADSPWNKILQAALK
jgi:hypothetical protein